MVKGYVPDAGDIVRLDDPHAAGHRPALVLSPAVYNGQIGLMLCCPMTTKIKGYPFEVIVPGEREIVVLADQVKSLDWKERNAIKKGKVHASVLSDVRAKAKALIG